LDDPYQTLGLPRHANQDEVRRAYRRLAKLHHPDLNPGNQAAEERFKSVAAANQILSDPIRRGAFDAGRDPHEQDTPHPRESNASVLIDFLLYLFERFLIF